MRGIEGHSEGKEREARHEEVWDGAKTDWSTSQSLFCPARLTVSFLQAAKDMVQDAVDLALMEGLHGHSRAAAMRLPEKQ